MANLLEQAINSNDGDQAAKLIQEALGIQSDDVVNYVFPKTWPSDREQHARSREFARPTSPRTTPWTFSQDVVIHNPDRALAGQIFQKHENKFARTGVLPMTELARNFVEYFKGKREAALETLVRITFGAFMGGLVLLLTLLYSGVPIV